MQHDGEADRRSQRGRVVVLVDNTIDGDSRVQKTAQSAATAGWDVTLIGRSPVDQPQSWHLGDVDVRQVPVAGRKVPRRLVTVRAWLRGTPGTPGTPAKITSGQGAVTVSQASTAGQSARRTVLRVVRTTRRAVRTPWDHAAVRFWRAVLGDRSWRRLEPHLWEYEQAYGSVIDELKPDLIHANDFRMLGVGARAVMRARDAGRDVKLVWDAHEFLPGIKPWVSDVRWLPANRAHEREYAPYADAVITVSSDLADLLQREHHLAEQPTVVLNAPFGPDETDGGGPPAKSLRMLCRVDDDVPLLVYSGAAAPQRGLGILIEALPLLGDVHIALVVPKPDAPYVRSLVSAAARVGAADRIHVLPYVPHQQLVAFLASADAGAIPIQHWPNHEIALITKFFEYSHARLPIVVSDVRTMAETVRSTGQGEVFRAEDVADFVRAVRAVFADPGRYRAAYDKPGLLDGWTWQAQAEILDRIYTGLVPEPGAEVTA